MTVKRMLLTYPQQKKEKKDSNRLIQNDWEKRGTQVYDFKYNVLMKCLTAYKRSADDKNAN